MITPQNAGDELRKHFSEVTPQQFTTNVSRYCPEITNRASLETVEPEEKKESGGQLILFHPQPTPIPLNAYLACALSNLDATQRQLMFTISDTISIVCEGQGIDLYEPRKQTDPVHHPEVKDADVFRIDRERVLGSDLVIHLCHYPSTGSGEELDFAYNALIPLILISHGDIRVSRMITGIPAFKVEIKYREPEELRSQLQNCLIEIRPILEQRKMAFSNYNANIVGNKIRLMREEQGLTREEVACSIPLFTVEMLRNIEESPDKFSNPSLIQLREIATILKTTVADLVEPDLNERLMTTLQEWVANKSAARGGMSNGMNIRDRNKILRRMLLRIIDSLEEE